MNYSVDESERDRQTMGGAEGEAATNSQAKGSDSDETLENAVSLPGESFRWNGYGGMRTEEANLSGEQTEAREQ